MQRYYLFFELVTLCSELYDLLTICQRRGRRWH